MLDFENDEPIVHFDILTVQDGDDARFWSTAVRMLRSRAWRVSGRTEIRMPLADYLALVKSSHSLDELRTLIFGWTPQEPARPAGGSSRKAGG